MSTLFDVLYKETKNRPKTISERNRLIRDASRPVGTRQKVLDEEENSPTSPQTSFASSPLSPETSFPPSPLSPQTSFPPSPFSSQTPTSPQTSFSRSPLSPRTSTSPSPTSPQTRFPLQTQSSQRSPISPQTPTFPQAEIYPKLPTSPIPDFPATFRAVPFIIIPEESEAPAEPLHLNIEQENGRKTAISQEDENVKFEGREPSVIRKRISQALREAKERKLREQREKLLEETSVEIMENLRLDSRKLVEADKIISQKGSGGSSEGVQRFVFGVDESRVAAENRNIPPPSPKGEEDEDIPFPQAKSRIAFFEKLKK